MFNNKKGNETDFCESYKSEILGTTPTQKQGSFFSTVLKLLTILILLVIIVGVSIYGYNYFINSQKSNNAVLPPISVQVSEDDLVVEAEESVDTPVVVEEKEVNSSTALISEDKDINKIADDVKIAIAKSETTDEENETQQSEKKMEETGSKKVDLEKVEIEKVEVDNLEVPTAAPEAKYLEELADLSKEIDKERKK